ncbi:hypothetical protein MUP00_04895 [Candidatus Bathyarchaeota archaeon]|jgi:hypothetical protein|nr:hypothetical protein [Candidatus Bathyarchaeota archaeon]
MVYDEDKEVNVFWVVKQLGSPTEEQVVNRYRELFPGDDYDVHLSLQRWKDKNIIRVQRGLYGAQPPSRFFRRFTMANLIPVTRDVPREFLDQLDQMQREGQGRMTLKLTTPPSWYRKTRRKR